MTSARGYIFFFFFARVFISGILICYLYVGGRLFVTPQLRVINHVVITGILILVSITISTRGYFTAHSSAQE